MCVARYVSLPLLPLQKQSETLNLLKGSLKGAVKAQSKVAISLCSREFKHRALARFRLQKT